jgi:hypothetical protein
MLANFRCLQSGTQIVQPHNDILPFVVSALAWGRRGAPRSANLPGGLSCVADALVIVS